METLERNHISYQEMDGLIELAEKVSVNIEDLRRKVKSNQIQIALYSFFSITNLAIVFSGKVDFLVNGFMDNIIPSAILSLIVLLLFASIVQIFLLFRKIVNIKLIINREEKVIKKILNMIEGYKDLYIEYGNESSVLSKALFEMRLSRINFGVK
jgi:hypothetical protein